MTIYESTQRNFRVNDEKLLVNVPYINDEVITKKNSRHSFIHNLETTYEAHHEDEETRLATLLVDELFVDLVDSLIPHQGDDDTQNPSDVIFHGIGEVLGNNNVDAAKLRARYFTLTGRVDPTSEKVAQNIDSAMTEAQSRELTLKSYQKKFCRRCFMYGCRNHDHIDAPAQTSDAKGDLTIGSRQFACSENCCKFLDGTIRPSPSKKLRSKMVSNNSSNIQPDNFWTGSDQSVYAMLSKTMTNCEIAKMLQTKTCAQVYEFAKKQQLDEVQNEINSTEVDANSTTRFSGKSQKQQKPKTKDFLVYADKVYEKQNYGESLNTYHPCKHDEPCSAENNCPCIVDNNFCEKFCLCSGDCRNRFQGCACNGKCSTKLCICMSLNRECDPDLCKKCGSGKSDVKEMTCKNVNIQRFMTKHLYLGKSDISGWGVFIKDAAKKDEFISVSEIR